MKDSWVIFAGARREMCAVCLKYVWQAVRVVVFRVRKNVIDSNILLFDYEGL